MIAPPRPAPLDHARVRYGPPLPLLSAEEEAALAARRAAGDVAARNALVEHNRKLAALIARHFIRRMPEHEDDLHSVADLGLLDAADHFDPALGRFGTFAGHHVRKRLIAWCRENRGTIRVPMHVFGLLNRPEGELTAPERRTVAAGRLALACRGTGGAMGRDDGAGPTLDDGMIAPGAGSGAEEAERRDLVRAALRRVDGRDRLVLRLRFGLGGDPPLTMLEVGDLLGVTRGRIGQIEASALGRIAAAFEGGEDEGG